MKYKEIKKKTLKSLRPFFRRKNIVSLQMVVFIGLVSLGLAFTAASFIRFQNMKLIQEKRHGAYEDEVRKLSGISANLVPAPDITENWSAYENKDYNFFLKYPANWQAPREIAPSPDSKYLLKIAFDEKGLVSEKNQKGFDVFIYDLKKTPDPKMADNLKMKGTSAQLGDCPLFDSITLGKKEYPAEEIFVKANDRCYEETFFYSLVQDGYAYNIFPREGKNADIFPGDAKRTLIKIFPEFYDIVSTLDLEKKETGLSQAPKNIYRKIASPPPVRFVRGPSCANKNDHPSYSKTKGKHMDEDCCPDPDEWPNPRCSYSSGALGTMKAKAKK